MKSNWLRQAASAYAVCSVTIEAEADVPTAQFHLGVLAYEAVL